MRMTKPALTIVALISLCVALILCVGGWLFLFDQETPDRSSDNSPLTHATVQEHGSPVIDERVQAIRASLEGAIREMQRGHIAVAERGDFVQLEPNEKPHSRVQYKDVWFDGDKSQWRIVDGGENRNSDWWQGFVPTDQPLIHTELQSATGSITSFDTEHPERMANLIRREDEWLYTSGPTVQSYLDLFVPWVGNGCAWSPAERTAAAPVSNQIAATPPSRWAVLGSDRIDGSDALLVEIEQQEPFNVGKEDRLNVAQVWLAWFLPDKNYALRRVEQSIRYRIGEKTYRPSTGSSFLVYDATDFRKLGDYWYPYAGKQETFHPVGEAKPLDWDALADEIIETDGANIDEAYRDLRLVACKEWRVIQLTDRPANRSTWIDPPPGAVVIDRAGNRSVAEGSRLQAPAVGQPAPELQVSSWIDGVPRTSGDFHGKVVVLDFWGTWCGPCVQAIPALQKLDEKYDEDVVFVSVHTPGPDAEDVLAFKKARGWTAIAAIDAGASVDSGRTALAFGVDAYPSIVILDRTGRIAFHSGVERPDDLQRIAEGIGLPWPLETDPAKNAVADEQLTKLQVAWLSDRIDAVLALD